MIIKTFRKEGFGFFGQNIESWTRVWNETEELLESSKNAEKDHLSPFFKKYFPKPPKKILEGGCGIGKYVIAYRRAGYDMVGVDFSSDTIRRIKKEAGKDFPVYEADITALPFDDGYFDCYYSGGVIEHFEEGPDKPLKEARRVIKKGGILLAAVPYVNLLRRFYFLIFSVKKEKDLLQKKVEKCQYEPGLLKGYNFCEYIFDANTLTPYFKAEGFHIEKTYPTDFLWGEVGLSLHKFIIKQHNKQPANINAMNKVDNTTHGIYNKSFIKNLAYDFLVTENRDNTFFKLPLAILNYLSGHMVLFVARAV